MEQLSRRLHQSGASPEKSGEAADARVVHNHQMPQRPAIRVLSPEAAGYIAGLVDGEGTVTLSRLHAAENRRLVLSIANTELPLLEYVRCEVGAGKITRKRAICPNHTPSFCYAISGTQALELLRQVQPHLRSYKRLRSQLALDDYRRLTPRNGKYTPSQRMAREDFESRFLGLKAEGSRSANRKA